MKFTAITQLVFYNKSIYFKIGNFAIFFTNFSKADVALDSKI